MRGIRLKIPIWLALLLAFLLFLMGCARLQPAAGFPAGQTLPGEQGDPAPTAQPVRPEPGQPLDGVRIDRVEVDRLGPGIVPMIQVEIYGALLNTCVDIEKGEGTFTQVQDGNVLYLGIQPTRQAREDCRADERPFFYAVGWINDDLAAGEYVVDVHGARAAFSLDGASGMGASLEGALAEAVEREILSVYGVSPDRLSVEEASWGDSCLELPADGETCTPGEVLGYRIEAATGARTWVYHAKGDGSSLRGIETMDQFQLWRSFPVVVRADQEAVNVRAGPGTYYPVIGQVAGGMTVEVLDVSPNGEWLLVALPALSGRDVWIYRGLVDAVLEVPWQMGENRPGVALPVDPGQLLDPVPLLPETFDDTFSAAWSPDGRRIVFVHEDFDQTEHRDLYVLNLESNSITRLTDREANDILPHWSPDGSQILFTSQYQDNGGALEADLYLVSADGSGLAQLSNGSAYEWGGVWSPDGGQVAFLSARSGVEELYRMNVDGSGLSRLTNGQGTIQDPQWSPDGTALIFSATSESEAGAVIYLILSTGTQGGILTSGHSPRWAPDGTRILFQRDDNLFILDVTSRQEVQLTNSPAVEAGAAWSPDGAQIVFHADNAGDYDLFLINADGSGLRRLAHPGQDDLFPAWSPDGQTLVFYSTRPHEGPGSLLIVGLNGFVPWGE